MEPKEVKTALRMAATEFASGSDSPARLWPVIHGGNLTDLCRDPLTGDFLRLFQALEHWEASVSPERERPEDEVRTIASNLGQDAESVE
jgi:hypothetical protein